MTYKEAEAAAKRLYLNLGADGQPTIKRYMKRRRFTVTETTEDEDAHQLGIYYYGDTDLKDVSQMFLLVARHKKGLRVTVEFDFAWKKGK